MSTLPRILRHANRTHHFHGNAPYVRRKDFDALTDFAREAEQLVDESLPWLQAHLETAGIGDGEAPIRALLAKIEKFRTAK